MRIIKVSNFGKEVISDIIVAGKVHNYYAKFIVAELNRVFSGEESPDFFRVVVDDYKLYIFNS